MSLKNLWLCWAVSILLLVSCKHASSTKISSHHDGRSGVGFVCSADAMIESESVLSTCLVTDPYEHLADKGDHSAFKPELFYNKAHLERLLIALRSTYHDAKGGIPLLGFKLSGDKRKAFAQRYRVSRALVLWGLTVEFFSAPKAPLQLAPDVRQPVPDIPADVEGNENYRRLWSQMANMAVFMPEEGIWDVYDALGSAEFPHPDLGIDVRCQGRGVCSMVSLTMMMDNLGYDLSMNKDAIMFALENMRVEGPFDPSGDFEGLLKYAHLITQGTHVNFMHYSSPSDDLSLRAVDGYAGHSGQPSRLKKYPEAVNGSQFNELMEANAETLETYINFIKQQQDAISELIDEKMGTMMVNIFVPINYALELLPKDGRVFSFQESELPFIEVSQEYGHYVLITGASEVEGKRYIDIIDPNGGWYKLAQEEFLTIWHGDLAFPHILFEPSAIDAGNELHLSELVTKRGRALQRAMCYSR